MSPLLAETAQRRFLHVDSCSLILCPTLRMLLFLMLLVIVSPEWSGKILDIVLDIPVQACPAPTLAVTAKVNAEEPLHGVWVIGCTPLSYSDCILKCMHQLKGCKSFFCSHIDYLFDDAESGAVVCAFFKSSQCNIKKYSQTGGGGQKIKNNYGSIRSLDP